MRKLFILFITLLLINETYAQSSCCSVTICDQIWMTHNLQTSTYRNGDPIPQVSDPEVWKNLSTGAWCWYNNDSATYSVYGKIYNWHAVNDPRGLTPWTWHIPSNAEWNKLVKCLDPNADTTCTGCTPSLIAGGAMKETGTSHWASPNTLASNSSGFTCLPAGARDFLGHFAGIGIYSGMWSSTQFNTGSAFFRTLFSYNSNVEGGSANKKIGYSVRCIKD